MQDAPDIDIDHPIPFIDFQFIQQRKRHQAGIADENIKAPEPILGLFDKGCDIGPAGHIELQRLGLAARADDVGGDHLQPVVAPRTKHTLAPRSARWRATASPMPLLAPVMATTLP